MARDDNASNDNKNDNDNQDSNKLPVLSPETICWNFETSLILKLKQSKG